MVLDVKLTSLFISASHDGCRLASVCSIALDKNCKYG